MVSACLSFMHTRFTFGSLFQCTLLFALFLAIAPAAQSQERLLPSTAQRMQWRVGDTVREALVYIPATARTKPTPVVFAFHGHGGTMQNMFVTRRFDTLWKEAIFICPQGLNTPGQLTDPEGKLPGWNKAKDSTNSDLAFFDAMLKAMEKDYRVDLHRIYATGHSNGGAFTYVLWATRGNVWAAVAPTAAAAAGKLLQQLKPKPAFHVMGETDPLVLPFIQKYTCNYIRRLNQCHATGETIAPNTTLYASDTGNPFEMYTHPGGHTYPVEVSAVIVEFFKKQAK